MSDVEPLKPPTLEGKRTSPQEAVDTRIIDVVVVRRLGNRRIIRESQDQSRQRVPS